MASSAAALLDELMGRNRNANPNDEGGNIKWDNAEVCKHFLCGYCPSELFTNTKADLGPCSLIHDEPLRREYQKSSRFEKMGYEERWIECLEDIVSDVDKKIKRGHQRLAMTQEGEPPQSQASGPKQEQITQLTTKINDLVENAERLGNEGKVEEAQGVMKLCEQLRKERQHLENISNDRPDHASQAKQMEVCPVCGAFLIVGDAESRQREHLMGKQHMGYAQMRATVDEFKEKKRQKIATHKAEMEKRREDERKKREERDRARRRSRSRDRRDRDRGGRRGSRTRRRSRSRDNREKRRSRSRGRRSRSRDRTRRKSQSRDRRRSRSTGRHRSRSRDRRRSKEKSKRSRSKDRHDKGSQRTSRAGSHERDRITGKSGKNEERSENTDDSTKDQHENKEGNIEKSNLDSNLNGQSSEEGRTDSGLVRDVAEGRANGSLQDDELKLNLQSNGDSETLQ